MALAMIPAAILTIGVYKEVRTKVTGGAVGGPEEGIETPRAIPPDKLMTVGVIDGVHTRARVDRGARGVGLAMSHVDMTTVEGHQAARLRVKDEVRRTLDVGKRTRRE